MWLQVIDACEQTGITWNVAEQKNPAIGTNLVRCGRIPESWQRPHTAAVSKFREQQGVASAPEE